MSRSTSSRQLRLSQHQLDLRRSVRTAARNRPGCVPAGGGERRIPGPGRPGQAMVAGGGGHEGRRRAAGRRAPIDQAPPGESAVRARLDGPARGHQQRWRRVGAVMLSNHVGAGCMCEPLPPLGTMLAHRAGTAECPRSTASRVRARQWRSLTVPPSSRRPGPVTIRLETGPAEESSTSRG